VNYKITSVIQEKKSRKLALKVQSTVLCAFLLICCEQHGKTRKVPRYRHQQCSAIAVLPERSI